MKENESPQAGKEADPRLSETLNTLHQIVNILNIEKMAPIVKDLIKNYLQTQNVQRNEEGAAYILDCLIKDDIERIKRGESPVIKVYPRAKNGYYPMPDDVPMAK